MPNLINLKIQLKFNAFLLFSHWGLGVEFCNYSGCVWGCLGGRPEAALRDMHCWEMEESTQHNTSKKRRNQKQKQQKGRHSKSKRPARRLEEVIQQEPTSLHMYMFFGKLCVAVREKEKHDNSKKHALKMSFCVGVGPLWCADTYT